MTTGSLIAIVIGLLILLAIAWFMTRAGRARADARYTEDARQRAADRSAGTVTESVGVATAGAAAPAAVPAHAQPERAAVDGANAFAGVEHDAVTSSEQSAAGAGDRAQATDGATATSSPSDPAAAMAATPFSAPDVPFENTEGLSRSQGGASIEHASAADGSRGATDGVTGARDAAADKAIDATGQAGTAGSGAERVAVAAAATAAIGAVGASALAAAGSERTASSDDERAARPLGDGGAFEANRDARTPDERAFIDPTYDSQTAGQAVPPARPAPTTTHDDLAAREPRVNPPVDATAGTLRTDAGAHGGTAGGAAALAGTVDAAGLPSAATALHGDLSIDSGDAAHDVREMIKILNLRAADAARLDLTTDEFDRVWQDGGAALDPARLTSLATTLRRMSR